MKIYHWNAKKNFGDLLASLLLKRFSNLDSQWVPPNESEMVMVGSIMHHLPREYNGIIAGIGKLYENTNNIFPNAKVMALRGELSAKGIRGGIVIGDPALLADELVPLIDKEYD